MKYVKTFESFNSPVNEELLGALYAAAKGALKSFLGNISAPFKNMKEEFKKGMDRDKLKSSMTSKMDTLLKGATDAMNKAEDEIALTTMRDDFSKEINNQIAEFDKEIKTVKESKLFEGAAQDALIGARVALSMVKKKMDDIKMDFDKKYAAAADLNAKKAVAISELKTVVEDFKKTIMNDEIFDKAELDYKTANKIESEEAIKGSIILDWGDVEIEVFKDIDVENEHPGYLKVIKSGSKKILANDLVKISGEVKKGLKAKLSEILRNGSLVPEFQTAPYETGPLEKIVVDGKEVDSYVFMVKPKEQQDLAKKLGDIKTDPEKLKKVSSFVDFVNNDANKEKIDEIEKIMGV